ncbi:hypothetical protein [[Limnothrix rosea] IAM M-220]|nr:hypothetical protein [[Limnothrix rosea] IAM M-220]
MRAACRSITQNQTLIPCANDGAFALNAVNSNEPVTSAEQISPLP